MKPLVLFIFFASVKFAHAQSIDALIDKAKLPKGLNVSVKPDTGRFATFPREQICDVTFYYAGQSITYYVFPYHKTDSVAVQQAIIHYLMISNCVYIQNNEPDKNFSTFNTAHYLFVTSACPCHTTENSDCATLAQLINKWRKIIK